MDCITTRQDLSITVVLGTYQGAPFLAQQLDSILNQTVTPTKICIRDDGSQDKTTAIIEEYRQKFPELISVIASDGNVGVIQNFSLLLETVTTKYAALSDQDDVWMPQKLERLLQAMQEAEKQFSTKVPLIVHSDLEVVDAQLQKIHPSFFTLAKIRPEQRNFAYLLLKNIVTGCACMVNRALLESALPIPQGVLMHDHWLALVATAFGKVITLNEPLIHYRQHSNNVLGAPSQSKLAPYYAFLKRAPHMATQHAKQAQAFRERFSTILLKEHLKTLDDWIDFLYQPPFWRYFYHRKIPMSHEIALRWRVALSIIPRPEPMNQ